MADDRVSSFIKAEALAELKQADESFQRLTSQIAELNKTSRGLEVGLKGAGNLKETVAAQKAVVDNTEKIRLADLRLQQQRERAFDVYERKLKQQEAAAARVAKQNEAAVAKAAKEAEKESKATRDLSNNYLTLKKAYEDAANKAKEFAATLGLGNKVTKAAIADARRLNDVLFGIESAVGQNQRNVGNYKSGFNGLSASIQQILREAPSAAVSLNTFFLAISNNLPMFFDEVTKINKAQREANILLQEQIVLTRETATAQALQAGATAEAAAAEAALAVATLEANAAQKAAPSLIAQIGKSLFSVNTLLTLSVLALTLFGGKLIEYVTALFKGKDAVDKFKVANENLKKALDATEFKTAVANVIELRENIKLARQGFLDKEAVVRQYNDTIGKTTGEIKNLNEAEAFLIKNADKYIQMMLYKAAAQIALQDAAQELVKQQREQEKIDYQNALNQKVFGKIEDDATKARLQQQKAFGEQRKKEIQKQNITQLDLFKSLQDKAAQIAKDAGFNFFQQTPEKVKAAPKPTDQTNENLKAFRDFTNERYTELKRAAELEAEVQRGIFEDDRNSLQDRLNAYEAYIQARLMIANYEKAAELEIAQNQLKEIQRIEGIAADKRTNEEKNLLLNKDTVTQKLVNIDKGYLVTVQKLTNDLNKFRYEETDKQLKKEADLRKKYREDNFASPEYRGRKTRDNALGWDDQDRQQFRNVTNYADASVSAVGGLIDVLDQLSQRRIEALNTELDLLDKRTKKEVEGIEKSSLSQDEKDRRIAEIEARAEARRVQIAEKQKQEQRKAAERQKAFIIAKIILETAAAVTNQLSIPGAGFAAAAAAAAVGAAQLATAIATPIPSYSVGTDDHPGGPAKVHANELVVNPDGTIWHTGSKRETFLPNLPKHSQVFPSVDDFLKSTYGAALGGGVVGRHVSEYDGKNVEKALQRVGDDIVSAIIRKPTFIHNPVSSFYSARDRRNIREA